MQPETSENNQTNQENSKDQARSLMSNNKAIESIELVPAKGRN